MFFYHEPTFTIKPAQHSQLSNRYTMMFETIILQPLYWFPTSKLIQPSFQSVFLHLQSHTCSADSAFASEPSVLNSQCPYRHRPPTFPSAVSTILYPRKAALPQPPLRSRPLTHLEAGLPPGPPNPNLVTDSLNTPQQPPPLSKGGENVFVLLGFQSRGETEDDRFWRYLTTLKNMPLVSHSCSLSKLINWKPNNIKEM